MPTTCKTVFVVHEIGGKAYGCVVGKTLSRLFFLPSENRTKNRRFCYCIRAGHDRISAKTAAVSIDAKVPPFTFRFPGA
ncbi:hypothetical protein, partial [Escherichia coli]|uniref:hypothetical protein n=1 Tax=Escherichia coli TaxID=562 RepID=UPI00197AA2E2